MKLTYGALDLTASPFSVIFGMDVGAPQNVTEALALLLQDGEVEVSPRASNRTLEFNVLIEGATLAACAVNEAALIAESEKPLNTLALDPEDSGPVTVYETFRAQVTHARDDAGELARLRIYTVTVRAYPFVRSEDETVTTALAASGSTTTLVNNGSAPTNWTSTVNGVAASPAVVSGMVKTSSSALNGTVTVSETYTASIDTSSTKYLAVDWKPESPLGAPNLRAYGDAIELTRVAQQALVSGVTRTWFGPVAAASIAVLRLDSVSSDARSPLLIQAATVRSLAVDQINRTDVAPSPGTARELQRTITVPGLAPAQGSVVIEHETDGLGDVLAYFWPDDAGALSSYSPPLRQYRTAGGSVTTDATLVSGAREELIGNTAVFDVPYLTPGAYLLVCRIKTTASGTAGSTVTWTTSTRVGGSLVGLVRTKTSATLDNDVNYHLVTLDRIQLPSVDVDPGATTALTRVTLAGTQTAGTGTASVLLDEAWLFNTTTGQLIQVGPGALKRVFIAAPTVSSPRPAIRVGDAADGSDSYYPAGVFWQVPLLTPPRTNVLTVTTGALDAKVSLRAHPRWHTNAAS